MVDLPEVIKTRKIKRISENVRPKVVFIAIFHELFLLWCFIITGEYCVNQTGHSSKLG